MNILIVSATSLEIEPLLIELNFEREVNRKLKRYNYNNNTIDVLIPGIGMTHNAYWLGKTLNSNYDFAINLGLAGSFDDALTIGTSVNVISDIISKLGTEDGENFLSLTDMGLSVDEDFILPNGEMKNNIAFNNLVIDALNKVTSLTVNTAHGDENSIQKIKTLFNPQIESMEGAAFFYACLSESISCVQIRTISNKVEKRNRASWDIPLAVKNLCSTGLEILKTL